MSTINVEDPLDNRSSPEYGSEGYTDYCPYADPDTPHPRANPCGEASDELPANVAKKVLDTARCVGVKT